MPALVLGPGVGGRNERDWTIGSGDWNRGVTAGRPLGLGLEDRRPAGKGLSHLASRAGAIRPPNYEIIEVLR